MKKAQKKKYIASNLILGTGTIIAFMILTWGGAEVGSWQVVSTFCIYFVFSILLMALFFKKGK